MPLFFFLAGYFVKGINTRKEMFEYIKKTAKGLLLPYYLYSALFIAILFLEGRINKYTLLDNIKPVLLGQGGGTQALYFFFALFVVRIIYLIIDYFFAHDDSKRLILAACIIVIIGFHITKINGFMVFNLSLSMYAFGYYVLGKLYRNSKINVFEMEKNRYLLLSMIKLGACNIIIYGIIYVYKIFAICSFSSKEDIFCCYFVATMNIIFICCLGKILCGTMLGRVLAFVGNNTRLYYPLTNFIPIALGELLHGSIADKLVKIIFSFWIPTVLAKFKKWWMKNNEDFRNV